MQTQSPLEMDTKRKLGEQRPPTRWQRVWAYRRLHLCWIAVFAMDQVTKALVASRLPFGAYGDNGAVEVIPGFFNIVHVGNYGAAWSILQGQGTMLSLLAVAMLCAIFFWRRTLGLRQRVPQIAFGMLCGGIVGNLADRIFRGESLFHGHVVDFLDFHFGSYTYPAFNVADMGICIGVILYVIVTLFTHAPEKKGGDAAG